MDNETIDETHTSLPTEVVVEIRTMVKWMTFTSVLLIIVTILQTLGSLIIFSSDTLFQSIISLLMNLLNLYLGFMVISKAGLFTAFADFHDENKLMEAMTLNKRYWLISTLIIIFSIVVSLIGR